MFVVDVVELGVSEDFPEIDRLHAKASALLDQETNALCRAVQLLKMKEDPRGSHQTRPPPGGDDLPCRVRVEKLVDRIEAVRVCLSRQVLSGLDADRTQPPTVVAFEPSPVVR